MYRVTVPSLQGYQQTFVSISLARRYANRILIQHKDIQMVHIHLVSYTLVDVVAQREDWGEELFFDPMSDIVQGSHEEKAALPQKGVLDGNDKS